MRRDVMHSVVAVCLGVGVCPAVAADDTGMPWQGSVEWTSRYVREGIDRAPGRTAVRGGLSVAWYRMALEVDWVNALGRSISESRIGVEYGLDLGDFDLDGGRLFAGGRRAGHPSEDLRSTWEAYGGVRAPLRGGLRLDLEAYADVYRNQGGFMSIGLSRPWQLVAVGMSRVSITPGVLLGIDGGAVSGGSRWRENHAQANVDIDWTVSPVASLAISVSHSEPLSVVNNQPGGRALTWGGVGAWWRF